MTEDQPPVVPRRSDTPNPHRSRARALRILYQADVRGIDAVGVLERARGDDESRRVLDGEADGDDVAELDDFTRILVTGATTHRDALDAEIASHARGWQIHRMPVIDRSILRLATFELRYETTPPAVVIDEAVEFAKQWSTADSSRFVNGVLEAIRRSSAPSGDA